VPTIKAVTLSGVRRTVRCLHCVTTSWTEAGKSTLIYASMSTWDAQQQRQTDNKPSGKHGDRARAPNCC
jgi:hypothetical protein